MPDKDLHSIGVLAPESLPHASEARSVFILTEDKQGKISMYRTPSTTLIAAHGMVTWAFDRLQDYRDVDEFF